MTDLMRFVPMFAMVTLLACNEDAPPVPGSIPVSSSQVPLQTEPNTVLALAPEPSFSVGLADGPEEYLFSRISGAIRTSSGDVIVAVQGYNEIRRFAPNGDHLWTAGRHGLGPGEFEWLELPAGCTTESAIIAIDPMRSISEFDGNGNLIRSNHFDWLPFGYKMACAPSGRMILTDHGPDTDEGSVFRLRQNIAYADGLGFGIEVIRTGIPGEERFQIFEDGHPWMSDPRTWGRELLFAPTDDGVWMTTGDAYEVEFLDWNGATVRRIRWTGPPQDVTADHLRAFRERLCRGYRLLGTPDWRQGCNRRWQREEPLLPSSFPSVARLLIADDGRLWVEHFRRPGESRQWLVFDEDGTWASSLRLPMRMHVQDAGRDWVLVRRTTDDLNVDVLEVYPITPEQ